MIIWAFSVTLTLNAAIFFSSFFHRTLRLMMLYNQTKYGCKRTSSLEDKAEIVIFWLHKPSLWPWHWRQWTNLSAWHSDLRCFITVPRLVAKYSAVQMVFRQTVTDILNLRCDLDLECSNPFFPTGHSGLWCCTIKPSLVANGPAV